LSRRWPDLRTRRDKKGMFIMKRIEDRFGLLILHCNLSYLSDYLEATEGFLETSTTALNEKHAAALEDAGRHAGDREWNGGPLGNPEEEIEFDVWMGFEDDLERLENVFPDILRSSFFVAAYFVFEVGLIRCCNLLDYQRLTLQEQARRSKVGIVHAREYLKNAGVEFTRSSASEWEEIQNYRKLRNCIVHNEGALTGWADSEHLKRYASRKPHLELRKRAETFVEMSREYDKIVVRKGFCEKVLQTMDSFLHQLEASLEGRERSEDF